MHTSETKGKIIAIGELLVDLIPVDSTLRIHEEGEILKTTSGSSGIFACALAKIGGHSAFIGRIGRDELSRMAMEVLKKEHVDVSRLKIGSGQIGLAFVEQIGTGRNFQYYRENSAGSCFSPEDVDIEYIKSASAIHYSGMLLEVSNKMREACWYCVETARENGIMVSFDPNIRKEIINGDEPHLRLLDAVSKANIISPTLEEARFITGKFEIDDILETLHTMGPRVVAVTLDKEGAIVSMDGKAVKAGGISVPVLDTTGAGDTFAAMLIYGILQGWDIEKIALYCNCAGALATMKCGTIGRALPTMEMVEKLVSSHPCSLTIM